MSSHTYQKASVIKLDTLPVKVTIWVDVCFVGEPCDTQDIRSVPKKRSVLLRKSVNGKAIPVQAMEAHRVVRGWGSHTFYTIGSQTAVRLSALRAGRPLPPRKIPGTHFYENWVDPRAIVRLEGLGQLKKFTSSGPEPATFRLVAQCLNQLRYRPPPQKCNVSYSIFRQWLTNCIFIETTTNHRNKFSMERRLRRQSAVLNTMCFFLDFLLWPPVLRRSLPYWQMRYVYVPSHIYHAHFLFLQTV
jgi:hypothetical protein